MAEELLLASTRALPERLLAGRHTFRFLEAGPRCGICWEDERANAQQQPETHPTSKEAGYIGYLEAQAALRAEHASGLR